MKSLIVLVSAVFFFTISSSVNAATSTAASDLLNKITDKVAQLGQVGKMASSGKIRSLGKTSINLVSDNSEVFVDSNEATKFYRVRTGSRSEIDFKSLKVNDDLSVIGIYDETSKTLTAKQVVAKIQRYAYAGSITTVSKNGIILDPAPQGLINLTDLSSSLTMYKLDTKNVLTKAKVSDPAVGDWISLIGYIDSSAPNSVTALKFILVPQSILTETPSATPSAK